MRRDEKVRRLVVASRGVMNILVAVALGGPALLWAQAPDADKVMADMRAALGGADRLAAVKTLTAKGTIQRVTARGTVERAVEMAMALPDKYVTRSVAVDQGNMSVYLDTGFNGDGAINRVDGPPDLSGGVRSRLALRDRAPAAGATQTPEEQAAAEQRVVLSAKRDFARLALGMFGTSFWAYPLQFSYAGEAESGEGKAHVIGVRGADGFEARLFVDVATSLPLMVAWSEPSPRDAGTMVDLRLYYSNFRSVGGLKLPHTFQRSVAGKVASETTYEQVEVNPKIDDKKFAITKFPEAAPDPDTETAPSM